MNNFYKTTDSGFDINIPKNNVVSMNLNLCDYQKINIVLEDSAKLNLNLISKSYIDIESNIIANQNSYLRINNYIYVNNHSKYSYDILAKDYSDVKINVKMQTKTQIDGIVNITSNNYSKTGINYIVIGEGNSKYNLKQNVHHLGSNSNHLMQCSGVLRNESYISLIGEIHIDENLRNVETRMRGKSITYDDSKMYSIPILKIWSNDVRTEHSVSSIPESQLYNDYILSRGINKERSKTLFEENLIRSVIKEW